jgi:NAD(P)-dependent dehydrogenase (short-subunit alcohol dehydrogenase family)
MRLANRTALVTGGGTGIGRAIALRLAREGARVVVAGRRPGPLEAVVAEITAAGGAAAAVPADVSRSDEVRRLFVRALEDLGRLDVLVNNAGSVRPSSPELVERARQIDAEIASQGRPVSPLGATAALTDDEWRAALASNLDSTFYCCREAVRIMEPQRAGRIVNVASISGMRGLATHPDYSAAKAGVIGFTKALAQDVAACGIVVNVIAPGAVDTEMAGALLQSRRQAMLRQALHGRAATPEEIAGTALYLASDDSGHLTGQVISPTGGLYM